MQRPFPILRNVIPRERLNEADYTSYDVVRVVTSKALRRIYECDPDREQRVLAHQKRVQNELANQAV
jgi:hypothetical protein